MAEAHEMAARVAQLEADNTRLRRLLDATGAPDGLRHSFRDTMAMLRAVLRLSAETAESVDGYATHLEGRLDAIARVRVSADTFGDVNLHTLISDELMIHLIREGEQAQLAGPAIRLRPKPAQLMALAIHELASNAVEHGVFGLAAGDVAVAWSVDGAGAGHRNVARGDATGFRHAGAERDADLRTRRARRTRLRARRFALHLRDPAPPAGRARLRRGSRRGERRTRLRRRGAAPSGECA
jgi:two-component sensor histidine kinase